RAGSPLARAASRRVHARQQPDDAEPDVDVARSLSADARPCVVAAGLRAVRVLRIRRGDDRAAARTVADRAGARNARVHGRKPCPVACLPARRRATAARYHYLMRTLAGLALALLLGLPFSAASAELAKRTLTI